MSSDARPDLGEMLHRLTRTVLERERDLLAARGLEMWDYVVLGALEHAPSPTQAQLAASTGRDKTRLIANLDRLVEKGLVLRRPDPADRRNRVVRLTGRGRTLLGRCRADVRAMEDELLDVLSAGPRGAFLRALLELDDRHRPDA